MQDHEKEAFSRITAKAMEKIVLQSLKDRGWCNNGTSIRRHEISSSTGVRSRSYTSTFKVTPAVALDYGSGKALTGDEVDVQLSRYPPWTDGQFSLSVDLRVKDGDVTKLVDLPYDFSDEDWEALEIEAESALQDSDCGTEAGKKE